MRLLILTQKVDRNDAVLGFFHRWLEEFAMHCESVTVICLEKGEYVLPDHVSVFSLGKEEGVSRVTYLKRFYTYLWRRRQEYDRVFVHMNQEYVLLGGLMWRALGKRILLWRNHTHGTIFTRIAVALSHAVFCTSPHSFTARFKKTTLMPVGIDTAFFKPDTAVARKSNSILFLGRIAPVKNVALFVEALRILNEENVDFSVTIAGDAIGEDSAYETGIRDKVKRFQLESRVTFIGAVTQKGARDLYRTHDVYVNLTPSGSLDKTIFEAMSVGTPVLVANEFFNELLPPECLGIDCDPHTIARNLSTILERGTSNYSGSIQSNIDYVAKCHSLHETVRRVLMYTV